MRFLFLCIWPNIRSNEWMNKCRHWGYYRSNPPSRLLLDRWIHSLTWIYVFVRVDVWSLWDEARESIKMIAFANVKFCLSFFLSLSLLLVLELYSPAASVFWLRACWQTERKDRYRPDPALAYQYRSICYASICPVLLHRSNCLLDARARSLSLSLPLSPSPSHTLCRSFG